MIGIGMGLTASPTLIAAQSSVGWDQRGMVTGTNLFARSMGSALGIAVFGAIANAELRDQLGGKPSATAAEIPAAALDPALHEVFVGSAATKFNKETLELTDQGTKDAVKAQLAAFAKFISRVKAGA